MQDPVKMYQPNDPTNKVEVERVAYRDQWYVLGWRSDDDPGYSASSIRNMREFTTVPPAWGKQSAKMRAEVNSRVGTILVVGDSNGTGGGATQWRTKGFVGVIREKMQALYGNAGSGFVTADYAHNNGNLLIPNPGLTKGAGQWTVDATKGGPNGSCVGPSSPSATTWIDFIVDTAGVISILSHTDPSYGRYDYQVDGGSVTQVPQNLAAGLQVTNINVSAGIHTVRVLAPSGQCRIYGVQGSLRSSGVVVQNFSFFGRQTDDLPNLAAVGQPAGTTALDMTMARVANPPDIAILCVGINDTDVDQTEDAIVTNLEKTLRRIRGTQLKPLPPFGNTLAEADNPADLIVILEHRAERGYELVGQPDVSPRWARVQRAMRNVADVFGAALVDMWAAGDHSYTKASGPSGILFDTTGHYNDNGHAALADACLDLMRYKKG